MAKPGYNSRYQYETSPRKLEPEYNQKKISNKKNKNTVKTKIKKQSKGQLKKIIYVISAFLSFLLYAIETHKLMKVLQKYKT